MRARRGGVGAEDVDVDEDKSQWGRQQGGATAPGKGIQCVRALFTLRRAHRRTIKGMECVCEHYSRCVVARTAAPLGAWNVCEHYSRCVVARSAASLGAWKVCACIIHAASSRAPPHHWGHGMCVRALFTLRHRAHRRIIGGMECARPSYNSVTAAPPSDTEV